MIKWCGWNLSDNLEKADITWTRERTFLIFLQAAFSLNISLDMCFFFLKQLFAKLWPLIWRDIGTIIRVYTLLLNEIELAFWLSGTILMWVYDEYSADSVQLCYCPWQPTGRQISFSPWCFEPLDRMCQLSLQNIMQKKWHVGGEVTIPNTIWEKCNNPSVENKTGTCHES